MSEQPEYKVIEDMGNEIEVREYPGQVWATTTSPEENEAFNRLAGYIYGGNSDGVTIPMTSPVITMLSREGLLMAFIMPKGVDANRLPKPLISNIEIMESRPKKMGVISFMGQSTHRDYAVNLQILRNVLKQKNRKIKGDPMMLHYDSPFTPPARRKNEIAVHLE
jgi:hypothetical protein